MAARATYSTSVSRGAQRHTSLDRPVHVVNVESLEHDLRHELTVDRIRRSFHSRSTLLEGTTGRQGTSPQSSPKTVALMEPPPRTP